jgi:hypothetical protein
VNRNENWIYWLCQVAGWGGYSTAGLAVATAVAGWRFSIFVGFILFFGYSIGLTHLLRHNIQNRKWLELRALPGLGRTFGAALAVGALQALLVILIARLLPGENAFDAAAMAGTVFGLMFVTSGWAAIYIGVHWYRRYREAQLREIQARLSQQQAELRALQAQVNPHFLFNSLNTIRGAVGENPEQAQDMITSLANLFRRSLSTDGAQMIPLSEEMAAVSDYLALESARFEERLKVRVQVGPELERCPVPAMLVQTLVENAVKHGISKLPGGGAVSIRGTLESQSLILEIENTGHLQETNDGTHTGIANARERLRLLCGDKASLSLTEHDGAVAARVVIPQRV